MNNELYLLNPTRKTLHKCDNKSCPYSHPRLGYIKYKSIEALEKTGKQFTKCLKCFPDR